MRKSYFFNFLYNIIKYKKFYYEIKFLGQYVEIKQKTSFSHPFEDNKRILIYGFGPYGEELFVKQFCKSKIVGIVDRNFKIMGNYIEAPSCIDNYSFDYVVVTTMNSKAQAEIYRYLHNQHNIPKEKIVLLYYVDE